MIPIGDDQVKGQYNPVFTWLFIAINIIVFLFQVTLSEPALEEFIYKYALIPADIVKGENLYTLFTSMFMHGGWAHIAGNMVFLWIFGDNIEARIGNFKFLLFYLLAGLGADFLQIIMGPSVTIPNLGASGAISGILGAYLLMFPTARIKMLNPSVGQAYYVGASQFLLYWIVVQLFSGMGSLFSMESGGVAYFAHIGGFIVGLLGGSIMKKTATKGILESSTQTVEMQKILESFNKNKNNPWQR